MEKHYTIAEASELCGRSQQFLREQIKANKIPGCTATKVGAKNWSYDIPRLAFDNHLRGANSVDIEGIKQAVKVAFKEVLEEMAKELVEKRLSQ